MLQGGGAPCACQAGIHQAMHEASMAPDRASGVSSGVSSGELTGVSSGVSSGELIGVSIGVSIGAITAAVSAGNPTEKSLGQPERFRTTTPLLQDLAVHLQPGFLPWHTQRHKLANHDAWSTGRIFRSTTDQPLARNDRAGHAQRDPCTI
jgi:predicted acylesterase/phospholipase RssA